MPSAYWPVGVSAAAGTLASRSSVKDRSQDGGSLKPKKGNIRGARKSTKGPAFEVGHTPTPPPWLADSELARSEGQRRLEAHFELLAQARRGQVQRRGIRKVPKRPSV